MPDIEDVLDSEEESIEEPEAPKPDSEIERLRRKNRELLAENKTYREQRRQALLGQHEWLTEDMIRDLPLSRIEALLSAIPKPSEPAPVKEPDPPPGEAAFTKAAQMASTTATTDTQTYSAKELQSMLRKGQITSTEMNQMIADGRMKT